MARTLYFRADVGAALGGSGSITTTRIRGLSALQIILDPVDLWPAEPCGPYQGPGHSFARSRCIDLGLGEPGHTALADGHRVQFETSTNPRNGGASPRQLPRGDDGWLSPARTWRQIEPITTQQNGTNLRLSVTSAIAQAARRAGGRRLARKGSGDRKRIGDNGKAAAPRVSVTQNG